MARILVSPKMELRFQDPSNFRLYSNSYDERRNGPGGASETYGGIVEAKRYTGVTQKEEKSPKSRYTEVDQGQIPSD